MDVDKTMITVTMETNNVISSLAKIDKNLMKNLQKVIKSRCKQMTSLVRGLVPRATGVLATSISSSVEVTPTEVSGYVYSDMPYSSSIESGARPHWPGRESTMWFRNWLFAHGIGLDSTKKEQDKIIFLVKRQIARQGIIQRFKYKGAQMFQKSFDQQKSSLTNNLADCVTDSIEKSTG